jgi:hypothetical protein
MATTKRIPVELFQGLDLHEGDTFQVIAVLDNTVLVQMKGEEESPIVETPKSSAAKEWTEHAAGIIKLGPEETEKGARMSYYREKYGLNE